MPTRTPKDGEMSHLQEIVYVAVLEWFGDNEEIAWNHRPDWLLGLEIDIFIPRLGIAIEVQGRQHHFFCPTIHKTLDDHLLQRYRDGRKRLLIARNRMALFCVREGDKRVLGGLARQLSRYLKRPLKTPAWLQGEWYQHQHHLNTRQSIIFKVRKGGKIVPVNKASSDYSKAHELVPG